MTASRNLIRKRRSFDENIERRDCGFTSDCHVWLGNVGNHGYGKFGERNVRWLAHRYAYVRAHGEIPHGLTIDHLCLNRACCNPAHLEVVTRAENTRRQVAVMVARGHNFSNPGQPRSPFCIRGHDKRGGDTCPVCAKETRARHRDKLRATFGTCSKPGGFGAWTTERIERQRAARGQKADLVAELYRQGVPTPDIARKVGLAGKEAVYHLLKVAGVKPNRAVVGRPDREGR